MPNYHRCRFAEALWREHEPSEGMGPLESYTDLAEFRYAVLIGRGDDERWFEGVDDADGIAMLAASVDGDEYGVPYIECIYDLGDDCKPVQYRHAQAIISTVTLADGTVGTWASMPEAAVPDGP